MLEYFGMRNEGGFVEEAIQSVIRSGVCTPDLGGSASTKMFGSRVFEVISKR